MNVVDLDTFAMLESYISIHKTYLGFLPLCIGVPHTTWLKLKEEAESHMRYTQAKQKIVSLTIYNIPIIDCGG
jgi:hypothetical protein